MIFGERQFASLQTIFIASAVPVIATLFHFEFLQAMFPTSEVHCSVAAEASAVPFPTM